MKVVNVRKPCCRLQKTNTQMFHTSNRFHVRLGVNTNFSKSVKQPGLVYIFYTLFCFVCFFKVDSGLAYHLKDMRDL